MNRVWIKLSRNKLRGIIMKENNFSWNTLKGIFSKKSSVEKKLEQVEEAIKRGELEEARKLLEEAKQGEEISPREEVKCWIMEANLKIIKGELEGVTEILKEVEKRKDLEPIERVQGRLTEIRLMITQRKFNEALELGEEMLKKSQELGEPKEAIRALLFMSNALIRLGKYEKGLEINEKGEKIVKEIEEEEQRKNSKAILLTHKGAIYNETGEREKALKCHKEALKIRLEMGNKKDAATSYNNLGVIYGEEGDLNLALENFLKALEISREIGNIKSTAYYLNNIGGVYQMKGELDLALKYLKEREKINEKLGIESDYTLQFLGMTYKQKGQWKEAMEYLKRSQELRKKLGHKINMANGYLNLMEVALEQNDIEEAEQYLEELEAIREEEESNKVIDHKYRLAKAMILKTGKKMEGTLSFKKLRNMLKKYTESQEILKEIIDDEVIHHQDTVKAIYNLCELQLIELKTFGEKGILKEIKKLTKRLLQIAENQNSYSLLTKTYFLKSKLALLEPDIEEAKKLLVEAQEIAEKKGYNRLAILLKQEYKKLTGELPEWLIDEKSSFLNRLREIELESLVVSLRQNRVESYNQKIESAPTMADLQTFTDQLQEKKITW